PSWTLQTLVLMPLIPPLVARLLKVIYDNYRRQQDKFAAMSGISQEIISGIRVIKSYAQEFNQTRLFNVFNYQYEKASNQVAKSDAYFPPIMEFGVTIGSVILLTLGAPEVMDEKVTIGAFFAFYQYIQRMIWPMTALGIGFNNIQQGKASFGRIADLLMVPNDLPDSGPCEIDNFQSLKVENLSFAYPERPQLVLKDISFEIKAGETIGLIGETGSGKSTLIELLCRLYPVPEKTIFYNSIPIEELKKRSLSRLVSLVPQEAFLFSKPIQENIAFSQQEWSMDQIQTLSQLLNIDEEINQIPLKYEALLGERGVNLSGGQKQRLTIARALMASTPLIIFDDSLSAVDAKTERKILENFYRRNHQTTKKSTLLIVSHRIASLIQTDRTIVLKNGEVESIGSHRQLLLNSPTYRQLNLLQSESVTNDEL
ncbi:MAG: ABC transporter ATP-binding protein, partial [Bdellovibrionales bacterium]|nr:ABC transporter ATP-binding protein [Bdellovibrionales bacterium]